MFQPDKLQSQTKPPGLCQRAVTILRIGRDRGKPLDCDLAALVTVTTHPSAILRVREDDERNLAMDAFVADLEGVAAWLASH